MPRLCCLCALPLTRIDGAAVNCSGCENIFHRSCVPVDDLAALTEFKCVECDVNKAIFQSDGTTVSIVEQLKSMQDEIASIKSLQSQSSMAIKNVEAKLGVVTNLAQQVSSNSSKINAVNKSITELQRKVTLMDSYEKARQIVVTGYPQLKDENLHVAIKTISIVMGVDMPTDVIDKCFRFRPKSGDVKPILVIFSSSIWRDKLLNAFRRRKKPIMGIELRINSSAKVIIGEHLSSDQKSLLAKARKDLVETKLFSFVWFQNNKVLARENEGKKISVITSIGDINRLKEHSG